MLLFLGLLAKAQEPVVYTSLRQALKNKATAEVLDLSDKHLKKLDPRIGELTELKYLNISFNKIKEIPAEVAKLKQLRHFIAEYNELTEVPAALKDMSDLQVLYLAANQIKVIHLVSSS